MKKLYLIFLLACLFGVSNNCHGFATYYYPTGATVSGGGTTVCQGGAASPLTCTVPTAGYTVFLFGGPSVAVTYTWYYNTTGSVVSGTPVPGYTGLTYTAAAGSAILTLPSAAISTATIGLYYYYVILTGINTADGSFSPIYITSNTQTINVIAPTSSIVGPSTVCSGSTITLTDASGGGTWTSSSTGIATVSGGVVTGVGVGGVATISYSVSGGCTSTHLVTVNPLPMAITGTEVVCAGNTTVLTDGSGVGTWTSGSTGIATVGSGTGIVSGVASGTSTIVFSLTSTGCSTSAVVTVNAAASPITGTQTVCVGKTTTLSDVSAGGTWTSAGSGIASVVGGVVTGVSAGITTISYTLPSGCAAPAVGTVNALPSALTGSSTVCHSYTTTLSDAGGASGTWSSGSPGIAPVGSTTGIVTGSTLGSAVITYALTATGCYTTFNETVNPLPAIIQGPTSLCANATATLTDSTSGGTWTSGTTSAAGIAGGTGIITGASAGTTTITYTIGTGCFVTQSETVLPIPAPITGDSMVCSASSITESDITGASTWSLTGSGASIGASTGIISATLAGSLAVIDTAWYTITATGCKVHRPITVNPLPSAIAGIVVICDSSTTNLFNSLSGGVWTSGTTAIATINSASGVVFGVAPGVDNITYTIPATGCMATTSITVAPPPAPISGVQTLCPLLTTTLSDGISSGTWLSGTPSVATINPSTGVINGIAAGNTVITYELGICATTVEVTVYPLPATIGGPNFVCNGGATITLTDATGGGSFSSNNTAIAPINPSSGVLTGLGTGTAVITYQVTATGCYQVQTITIEPLPDPITGPDSVCLGYSVALADDISGGTFSTGSSVVATVVGTTGVVTGISAGTTQITYTLSGTGCKISVPFHVNPVVSVSTMLSSYPGDTICAGNTETFTLSSVNAGTSPVYQWKVNSATVPGATNSTYSYNPANGEVIKCVLTSNATCAIPNTATSNSIHMTVNPVTNPTVTMYPGSNDTLCMGTAQTYSITSTWGGTAPVYLWTVNWMPVATGVTSYAFTPANGDIIRCGMISSSPCPVPDTAFAVDTIIVRPYKTPAVTIDGLSSISACQGNSVSLTANATWGGWNPVYHWSVNGIASGTSGNTFSYMPANNDVVEVIMTSNYPCTVPGDSANAQISIQVDPVIVVSISDSRGGLVSRGTYDTLTANVLNGGTNPTYQWLRNGAPIPGANYYQLAMNDFSNGDSVSCTVTTNGGSACDGVMGHAWKLLEVAPVKVGYAANQITDLKVLPNPNTGYFVITGSIADGSNDATISITDMVGQEIFSSKFPVLNGKLYEQLEMDGTLSAGMYLLHISTATGSVTKGFSLVK